MFKKQWKEAMFRALGLVNVVALMMITPIALVIPFVNSGDALALFIFLTGITIFLGTLSVTKIIEKYEELKIEFRK